MTLVQSSLGESHCCVVNLDSAKTSSDSFDGGPKFQANRWTRRRALALIAAVPLLARAADTRWPTKQVRIVVPFPVGGGGDTVARLYATRLSAKFGLPFIVENKPGADGVVASDFVARSAADGHTLLLEGPTFAINMALGKRLPYSPLKDFVPIVQTSLQQLVLVVHPVTGIRSTSELIQRARRAPGVLNYASSANSTALPMELFKSMAGVDIRRVPYKGAAAALTALLSKEVDVSLVGAATVYEHVKAGKLVALAIGDSTRSEHFPDLPTIEEGGVVGFQAMHWTGLFAPRSTSAPIVNFINQEVRLALADPDFRQKLISASLEPPGTGNTPAEWATLFEAETVKWARIVRASGLTEGT